VPAQKCSNNPKYKKSLNSSLFQSLPIYVYINLKVRAYSTSIFPKFRLNILSMRNYSSKSDANSSHNIPRSRVLAQIMGKNPIFYDDS
jgi:hypothetical protein